MTTAIGVVRGAEARGDPVLLLVAEAAFRSPSGRLLLPALLAVADAARVPACVQLDHVDDRESSTPRSPPVQARSWLTDRSCRRPTTHPSSPPSRARRRCRRRGRARPRRGRGGRCDCDRGGLAQAPDEAVWFVATTGCDCLAVSIGNVHGKMHAPRSSTGTGYARFKPASMSRSRFTGRPGWMTRPRPCDRPRCLQGQREHGTTRALSRTAGGGAPCGAGRTAPPRSRRRGDRRRRRVCRREAGRARAGETLRLGARVRAAAQLRLPGQGGQGFDNTGGSSPRAATRRLALKEGESATAIVRVVRLGDEPSMRHSKRQVLRTREPTGLDRVTFSWPHPACQDAHGQLKRPPATFRRCRRSPPPTGPSSRLSAPVPYYRADGCVISVNPSAGAASSRGGAGSRLERGEAEMAPLGDAHAARLGHLEPAPTSRPQTERPSIRSTATRTS